jgi:hypothetical protein
VHLLLRTRGTYELVSLENTPISVEFSNWVPASQHESSLERVDIRTAILNESYVFC